jgi:hypothetical protein
MYDGNVGGEYKSMKIYKIKRLRFELSRVGAAAATIVVTTVNLF